MTKKKQYVWCIEDEKYGLQLVCATAEIAEREWAKDKYHPSGYGACIEKREVVTK